MENEGLEPQNSPTSAGAADTDNNGTGDNAQNGGEAAEEAGQGDDAGKLAHAQALISDLKKAAGVKSVKELKQKFADMQAKAKPNEAVADAAAKATGDTDYLEMRLSGHTPDEIRVIKQLANGKPLTEAILDPVIKAAVDGVRASKKTEQAIPAPSNRVPMVNNKRFAELPKDEQKKHYGATMDKMLKRGQQKTRVNS